MLQAISATDPTFDQLLHSRSADVSATNLTKLTPTGLSGHSLAAANLHRRASELADRVLEDVFGHRGLPISYPVVESVDYRFDSHLERIEQVFENLGRDKVSEPTNWDWSLFGDDVVDDDYLHVNIIEALRGLRSTQ